ncbi:MAG: DUF1302 family protein, partial [Oceanococcus sp.]
ALILIDKRNIFSGWDLKTTIGMAGIIRGHSAMAGGFGALMGESDYRGSLGVEFTRLNKLTLGMVYSAYFGGEPDFSERPYQDRDNLAVTAKYAF